MKYFFSIIVPLYNQEKYLVDYGRMYNAINKKRKDFEVIFSDDGSSDGTRSFFSSEANKQYKFPFKYHWSKDVGFTVVAAKNRGIMMGDGMWSLILDGDTYIDLQTLAAYDRILGDRSKCYFGKRLPVNTQCVSDKLKHPKEFINQGLRGCALTVNDWRGDLREIPDAPFTHFSGANFVCNSEILKHVKYGNDDWVGYGYDDYYFALRWLDTGRTFKPVNDSIAYHADDAPKPGDIVTQNKLSHAVDFFRPRIKEKLNFDV